MAFTTSTADNYHDLLNDLRIWLTVTLGTWTELDWTPPPSGIGVDLQETASLSLQGPGAGSGKEVYVNIDTVADLTPIYSWRLYGAIGYTPSVAHGAQPGAGGPTWFNLSGSAPGSITYWFYANDRRFVVVALCGGTNYMSMYAGFFLPIALPSEYPFPLVILGSYDEMKQPDFNNAKNSSIVDPGDGAAFYRRRTSGIWEPIVNQGSGTGSVVAKNGERCFMWPHKTGLATGGFSDNPDYWSESGFGRMKLNGKDESVLFQPHIVDMPARLVAGSLEGVYSVCGHNRVTNQTLTLGGRTFRLFQRVFRNQAGDFFAVEEV
jgi:hypothetical protein